jgi:hypothetical protein
MEAGRGKREVHDGRRVTFLDKNSSLPSSNFHRFILKN